MRYATDSFRTTDKLNLFVRVRTPKNKAPRAVVNIVHGMFEHSGRFEEAIDYLTAAGFLCRAYDQRGHGQSEGKRGDTPSYAQLISDLERFFEMGAEAHPEIPHFLLGHSMGGCLVLNFVIRKKPKVAGVISSAPWLSLAFQPEAWKVHLGKLVAQVWPGFAQSAEMEPSAITRDKEQIQAYQYDTLMHTSITARFFLEAMSAGSWVMKQAHRLPVPLYLYHGTSDYVTSIKSSREFAKAAPEHLCTFEELDGMYHDIFHDLGREEVYQKMVDWLGKQLSVQEEEANLPF